METILLVTQNDLLVFGSFALTVAVFAAIAGFVLGTRLALRKSKLDEMRKCDQCYDTGWAQGLQFYAELDETLAHD